MTATPPKTRRERSDEIKQKFEAKERQRRFAVVGAVVVILVAIATVSIRNMGPSTNSSSNIDLQSASGRGSASAPPWRLPTDAPARVKAAGLSLGQMGTAEHYHAHLDILIDGQPVPMLANIGIDPNTGQMSAVHTHTADGIIHIEAGSKGQTFTLGQLFTQWNVRLAENQIGSLMASDGNTLTAYVNGEKVTGNPAMIRLAKRQQISLVYGPKDAKVDLPDNFDFGKGL